MNDKYQLFVDASGIGYGVVLTTWDTISGTWKVIRETQAKWITKFTVNEAEYMALLIGLTHALGAGCQVIDIFSDSELIVKQITGLYKAKKQDLRLLRDQVKDRLKYFDSYTIQHISGKLNPADRLSREFPEEPIYMGCLSKEEVDKAITRYMREW